MQQGSIMARIAGYSSQKYCNGSITNTAVVATLSFRGPNFIGFCSFYFQFSFFSLMLERFWKHRSL